MNNKITIDALRVLDAIESAGSFNGAAKILHKVRSAISHTVARLEEDLGVALYDRSPQRVQLTAAGREVLTEGRHILRAVAELETRARNAAGGWEPEFTIALDHFLPLRLLLPALQEFSLHAPDVTLTVIRESLHGSWDALTWRRADLAIGIGGSSGPGSECSTQTLGNLEMLFVAAPAHPLASTPAPLTLAQLLAYRYIVTTDTARAMQPRMQALAESRLQLSLADLRDKLEALRAGLGFGQLPRELAAREIAAHRLVELQTSEPAPGMVISYATRRQSVGKALDWFTGALADSGGHWLAQAFD